MNMVCYVSFDIDCAERSCRAEVFALAAAYTAFVVNSRHLYGTSVGSSIIHHLNSLCRAMACTSTAVVAFVHRDTVGCYPHSVTDMYGCLVLNGNGSDGISRANVRAGCTLRSAESPLEGQFGLHEPKQVG